MTRLDIPVACDVCHEPTTTVYHNATLLARDDVFCWFCFHALYEGGVTQEDQIRRASLRQRYEEDVPCPS